MSRPTVAVVLPVHDGAWCIVDALESVFVDLGDPSIARLVVRALAAARLAPEPPPIAPQRPRGRSAAAFAPFGYEARVLASLGAVLVLGVAAIDRARTPASSAGRSATWSTPSAS